MFCPKNILAFLFLVALCQGAVARFVSYSLSPSNAENVLAGLSDRPRILDDKWVEILGDRNGQTYRVKRGETLWDISRKLFGNGFYWSKLWETNPQLSNPHDLTKGFSLNLVATSSERSLASETTTQAQEIRIPLIKLVPDKIGGGTDLDSDGVVNFDVKNRFRPRIRILTPDDVIYGEITGSFAESDTLTNFRDVYVKATARTLERGEKFAIIHEERAVRDKTSGDTPFIGNLVQIVGELTVVEVGERLVKAQITGEFSQVHRGDKLIELQPLVNWTMQFNPPEELQCRIIMGEDSVLKQFGQGQLVLLNKGSVDGMKEGFMFRVWNDQDSVSEKESDVEPESKGDVQIIHVNALSSVGYIVRSYDLLNVGDTLIPRQAFASPSRTRYRRFGGSFEIE